MTRIIGGSVGGRRIRAPEGAGTRPTSDRVREALFSAVEAAVGTLHGLRFLDLYAGSGAVGLEARSRGADAVTLVEHDRRAAAVASANAATLGLTGVEVVRLPVARYLAGRPSSPFDVVFLDPPYAVEEGVVVADLEALGRGWLAAGALVVVERSSRGADVAWPDGYLPAKVKRYGETALARAEWSGTPPD
ncbi:16S rRNA (guanine(966)-N(2))-methyltransferase RsmD [Nocardioides caldifontis]|uniref:16S rRNA (guanine(966)-N(2))-methyltransferase RsmD n=1 Tax=Nocardioides caldifontis TaxID=2588938 RepID=UPI0011DFAC39|nr:16S rRNA (guanine(966)-N(2))-methyltransferase RsmD [Nocardioides caldifontis]